MKKWTVVTILAVAQFVMVLDSTVMNVSMSTVAKDLGTTINGLQAAITFYTLTMAAFMLTGGKLGDVWGKFNAFKIGAVVYSIGSLITALAPSLGILMLGWSFTEGLGAILVIPAIAALIAANYEGKDRVVAFAIIGGISGVAAAAGPLVGGFFTTYLSWRYVFISETAIMIVLLFCMRYVNQPSEKRIPFSSIDIPSVLLSAFGMIALVFGMLQSKTWGWVQPMGKPEIAGYAIAPLGISLVAYLLVTGVIILRAFYKRSQRLEAAKDGHPLVKVSMFKIPQLRAGLMVLMFQYVITAAAFFVIPVYLQIVLGYDALTTGIKILPMSVGLILCSVTGTRMIHRYSPKQIIRLGQILLTLGALLLLGSLNADLRGLMFGLSVFTVGGGLGLLASQIGNVTMTAVDASESSEVGGLQGTSQNLGSSFGTALIGSVMIASLTTSFVNGINQSTTMPNQVKTYATQNATAGIPVVSAQELQTYAVQQGVPQSTADEIASIYKTSEIAALQEAAFFIVLLAGASLLFSRHIPDKKLG
ncbi:MAG: MFS transporter [Candidatus Saccharibacteria bacterium]